MHFLAHDNLWWWIQLALFCCLFLSWLFCSSWLVVPSCLCMFYNWICSTVCLDGISLPGFFTKWKTFDAVFSEPSMNFIYLLYECLMGWWLFREHRRSCDFYMLIGLDLASLEICYQICTPRRGASFCNAGEDFLGRRTRCVATNLWNLWGVNWNLEPTSMLVDGFAGILVT
jgi:hypothetical protein